MSLFDDLAGKVASLGEAQSPNVVNEVTQLIGSGGLQGLLAQFQSNGLGNAVASWVGTGNNLPVSKEQILAVLGNDKVAAIAKSLGISPDAASHALSSAIPHVVDKLTPAGSLPSNDLLQKGLSMLQMLGK